MFTTDSRTENYLKRCGVEVEYREDLTYDQLVPDWNAVNHGRPKSQSRVDDAIATYAQQQREGSPMPATVLHKVSKGLDVLDGVQRLNGNAFNDYTVFAGYVVKCQAATALKIRICINNSMSGVAVNDPDFAICRMVEEFMIKGNESAADVAAFCSRRRQEVELWHDRMMAKERFRSLYDDCDAAPQLNLGNYDDIASATDPTDFDGRAGAATRKIIETLHRCRFKNGDFGAKLREAFNIKRTGNKNRATQLNSKLRTLQRDPIVKSKLAGKRTSTQVENINRHFSTLFNAVKKHKGQDLENEDMVQSWNEMHREIGRMLREQCTNKIRRKLDPFT